jgi:tetratricopeptide (TPR) repeat protein
MKRSIAIALLLLSLAAFLGLRLKLDAIPRAKVPGASILYVPSGKFLQYASFGNSPLLADLIYLWSIQYFSNTQVLDRMDHLEHVYSIISELDPHFLDPYQIGALIAISEAKDMGKALRILELGYKKNPDQWILPLEAGHYAEFLLKDYKLARKYFQIASQIDGVPDFVERKVAASTFELGDYKAALQHWLEIYEGTNDARIKAIANNHIYRTKASLDIETLGKAISVYRDRTGAYPQMLSQLVTAGILPMIPNDLDGEGYTYDPQTGEVTAKTWWKR